MFGLKSGFWIRATMRRLNDEGTPALIVQKGDEDAGSIFITLTDPSGSRVILQEQGTSWRRHEFDHDETQNASEKADLYLERQKRYDPDLWIIEVDVKNCADPFEKSLGSRKDIDL
ncbi:MULTISPECIES: DUF1491 family protein [unclassified Saccharibacter]|uniref:DUF1491 family protein n=1 Tax=unclassified Saccharibacter TaxID=2648722 RepID=UPI0013254545|nr:MULTISPECIES: DUF1491 family protein [unclassified Saccharibacter]MXV35602.1 DUF1491 family protein [Saccharibacter sp. EH611]MXV58853.1 DUF1491 family protein [Saccharibacter sp. EH70]MXV65509.1 DUF1491 family protein [Saccharibacter sp. EH60]